MRARGARAPGIAFGLTACVAGPALHRSARARPAPRVPSGVPPLTTYLTAGPWRPYLTTYLAQQG